MKCYPDDILDRQKFKVHSLGGSQIALQNKQSGKYCTDNDEVECTSPSVSFAERFSIKVRGLSHMDSHDLS